MTRDVGAAVRRLWLRRVAVSVALAAAVAAIAPAAHADLTVATVEHPTAMSAFAGRLVWSAYDGAIGAYRLMARYRDVPEALPIAPRSVPFDADVGPDMLGRPTVVYSRCRTEPDAGRVAVDLAGARWSTSRGCDIVRFDIAAGREQVVAGASTRGASEYLPSLSRGRIAFVRVYERLPGKRGRRPHLYVRSLISGRQQRLPGGRQWPRGHAGQAGPIGLDLDGRRLAFTWKGPLSRQPDHRLVVAGTEVRVHTLAGRRILAHSAGNPPETQTVYDLTAPSLVGDSVFFAFRMWGLTTAHMHMRYDLPSGRLWSSLPRRRTTLLTTTTDASATHALYGLNPFAPSELGCGGDQTGPPSPCPLVRLDPITYRPTPQGTA